jgi:hypothetical protein
MSRLYAPEFVLFYDTASVDEVVGCRTRTCMIIANNESGEMWEQVVVYFSLFKAFPGMYS